MDGATAAAAAAGTTRTADSRLPATRDGLAVRSPRREDRARHRERVPSPPGAGVSALPRSDRGQRSADLDVHLILDNYSTHKAPTIRRWLAQRPRFHLHFTPTYASWINQVDRWFAGLEGKALRRGSFTNVPMLKAAIVAHIDASNTAGKPFVWTKTADQILTAWPASLCARFRSMALTD